MDFTKHPNWRKINRLYYKKYKNYIVLKIEYTLSIAGIWQKSNSTELKDCYDFKTRSMYYHREGDTLYDFVKYYTNDLELISWLSDTFEVLEVSTPINEEHEAMLDQAGIEANTIIRDTLYYDKFMYKVKVDEPDYGRSYYFWARTPVGIEFTESVNYLQSWINENFTDRKSVRSMYTPEGVYNNYTNDQKSLMLLKMICPDNISIKITKVLTLNSEDIEA